MINKLKAYLGEVRLFQWAREEVRSIMEALKNCDHRVVGTKQVLRGLKSESLARVYVANDADTFLYQRIVRAAEAAQVSHQRVADPVGRGGTSSDEQGRRGQRDDAHQRLPR